MNVDWNPDGAKLASREHRCNVNRVIRQHDRNAVAAVDAVLGESVGKPARCIVDLAEADLPAIPKTVSTVRVATRPLFEKGANGAVAAGQR
jgi:hypothetical protein